MEVKGYYTPCRNSLCQFYHYTCPFCKLIHVHSQHIEFCEYPTPERLKRIAKNLTLLQESNKAQQNGRNDS